MNLRRGLLMGKAGVAYEAWDLSFNKTNYVDTGVKLFSQENINRDFEVILSGIQGDYTKTQTDTLVCAKDNNMGCGFLVRPSGNTEHKYNGTIFIQRNTKGTVIIKRINGVLSCEGAIITNQPVPFDNSAFDRPLVLGCAIDDNGNYYRYCNGTIDYICVRWLGA